MQLDRQRKSIGWKSSKEIYYFWRRNTKTLKRILYNNPQLKKDPFYDPKRFPGSFEDNLLMVVKKNGFTPVRANLGNIYEMDGKIVDPSGETLFWYDAEYHANDYLFDNKTGKIRFSTVHVPIEKKKYFEKYNPSVYIRGNLKYVLVLRGDAIVKCEKIKYNVPTSYGSGTNKVSGFRDFLDVHVGRAIAEGHFKTCKLSDWLKTVKMLFPLESAIANIMLEKDK